MENRVYFFFNYRLISKLFKEMKEIIFRLKRENKKNSLLVFGFVFREINILKKKLYFSIRIN